VDPTSIFGSSKDLNDVPPSVNVDEDEQMRKKREKTRLKRERARQEERTRDESIANEDANAGPSPRDIEMNALMERLAPQNLIIHEVEADGHCLYRAVAAQCRLLQLPSWTENNDTDGHEISASFHQIRRLCATTLRESAEVYLPFCEFDDEKGIVDFESYVYSVENSAEWGGHLELRVLSKALGRPIHVYSIQSQHPLVVEEETTDGSILEPIRLSYHLHYYALGEHYNHVVSVPTI
jgi:OTU domain-containing protein 6